MDFARVQMRTNLTAKTGAEIALASDLLWGAAAIATELGVPLRKAFYLLETRQIPAKKLGGLWVGSRRALREHFLGADNRDVAGD